MYGNHIGSLNVYTRTAGDSGVLVWSESVQQGNKWIRGQATILPQKTLYQV